MTEIEIDSESGFCFGVVTAIRKAEEELAKSGTLFCLGDIVHNSGEVERLQDKGLRTITHDDLSQLRNVKVLLRAHGEPPSTYRTASANGIEIIDAEVNGLVGQTEGHAIVVEDIAGLDLVDFGRPVALYSQTTKSLEGFNAIIAEIERRMQPGVEFRYFDTICRQVSNRVDRLRRFARGKDVVLFVAGAKSSNGKILFGHCLDENPRTHLLADESGLRSEWFDGASTVGICGATSTPRWLMERVRDSLANLLQ